MTVSGCASCEAKDRQIADLTDEVEAWKHADRRRSEAVSSSQRLVDWRTAFNLTNTEALLLLSFVDRAGRLMDRDAGMAVLSGTFARGDEPCSNVLAVYLSRARSKLKAAGQERVIRNRWGLGWVMPLEAIERLSAVVERHAANARRSRG